MCHAGRKSVVWVRDKSCLLHSLREVGRITQEAKVAEQFRLEPKRLRRLLCHYQIACFLLSQVFLPIVVKDGPKYTDHKALSVPYYLWMRKKISNLKRTAYNFLSSFQIVVPIF